MGYYTNFRIEVIARDSRDIISALRDYSDNASYALTESGGCSDQLKWYDHEVDMKTFSKRYPDVVFSLYGEGEESGDIWCKYFKNGKYQNAPAKITYDVFDESKLE